uniref:C-type lectin domain-containing protein n=1 Tax=Oryzias melastigma TaxID=30732 RepID=A0A3B3DF61_ORYME
MVPIFKNKGDVQSCGNYRGIKLMSHTMKVWERVVEARLRAEVNICEQQYGFMPRKSTTDLCPFKWQYLNGSLYYVSTTTANWQESRNDCLSKGADLVVINDAAENVSALIFQVLLTLSPSFLLLWIGLSDRQSEGHWIWQDGTSLGESFWQPGEPNSYSGRDEDCVEIRNFNDENNWNDLVCTDPTFWICEKKTGV